MRVLRGGGLVCAFLLGVGAILEPCVAGPALRPAQDGRAAPAGVPAEVAAEWAVRRRALEAVADAVPGLRGLLPAEGVDLAGERWDDDWATLDARARAARLADVGDAVDFERGRPELEAAALATRMFEDVDAAERVLGEALVSPFAAVRVAAVERLARALFEHPDLRSRVLPIPAGGRDGEATEALARMRATAGLIGGQTTPWLLVEGALGNDPARAIVRRFELLARAPLDARAVHELRRMLEPGDTAEVRGWVEALALIAAARDGVDVEPAVGDVLEAFAEEAVSAASFGAEEALLRALDGRTVDVERRTWFGEAAFAAGAANGDDRLLGIAARTLLPARALELGRTLGDERRRADFVAVLDERPDELDPEPFRAWLEDRSLGRGRDAALEVVRRRYLHHGDVRFRGVLEHRLAGADAWLGEEREASLDVFDALARGEGRAASADALTDAVWAAPAAERDDLVARLPADVAFPGLATLLVERLDAAPGEPPTVDVLALAATLSTAPHAGVHAGLEGAWQRSVAALGGVAEGGDGRGRLAGTVRAIGRALATLPEVSALAEGLVELAARGEDDLVADVLDDLVERGGGAAGTGGLAPLLEEVDGEGRAAVTLRVAEILLARPDDVDAAVWRKAQGLVVRALVRARAPFGRQQSMLRSLARSGSLAEVDTERIALRMLGSGQPFLIGAALELVARSGDGRFLLDVLAPIAREGPGGTQHLEAARAALALLPAAWPEAGPSGEATARIVAILGALAAPGVVPRTEDERFAQDVLRAGALDAAARFAARDARVRAELEPVLERLFDASLERAVLTTEARLGGGPDEVRFATDDPALAAFASLGGPGQQAAVAARPEVLVRLDARVLVALAREARDPALALALLVAADVACAGARPTNGTAALEIEVALALLARVEEVAEEDNGNARAVDRLAGHLLVTLVAKLRTGALPGRRVPGLLLDADVVDAGDARLWLTGAIWRVREPSSALGMRVRDAFLRIDPEGRMAGN